ncbi:MFS transporter [Acuticoccus sp.]|uniref:MFS transporter n=1 Tax=Acuticoccus sp. TaxID=1904378 RepID=UPI003B523AA8
MASDTAIARSMCQGEADASCPRHLRKYVLGVAVLGSSLGFIDGTIITVAVQPIREGLGASFAAVQWVVNGYTLTLAAFLLIGGAAGDRFGKRRVFAAGITLFAVASVACAMAPSVEALIVARLVQGLGAAMMVPASLALIAVNYSAEERGRAVGIWAAASGITSALGPILGGLLIDLGSWRWVFIINVPIAALTLAILFARVPADEPQEGGRFDVPGGILAFLAVGAVALGFTLAERAGLTAPLPIIFVAAGVALAALFVAWQARATTPMLPLAMFASRTFSVANAETLLVYFALGGILFFLPITMMEAHGWSATEAGAVFLPFTLTMAVVSPIAGRLADRIGARVLLIVGPLIVAAAFAALGILAGDADTIVDIAPAMMAFGVGMGLAIPPLSSAILNDVGSERSGVASGVNNAVARVAGLLAIAVLGLVASLVYQAATGTTSGFAGPVEGDAEARSAAITHTFLVLTATAATLCVAASGLALLLPRLREAAADASPA